MKKNIAIYLPDGTVQSIARVDGNIDLSRVGSHVEVPDGVHPDDGRVDDGVWVAYSTQGAERKRKPPPHTSEWDCAREEWRDVRSQDERVSDARGAAVRKRDGLLASSDWTQLPDVPLATNETWATYRQALRDITQQPGYPFNIIWPQAPQ